MTSLEKFATLGDVEEGYSCYAPYLNKGENKWYVEWLLVDEISNYVEQIYSFSDKDIDVSIDKAYRWYNEWYLKDKGDEGYMKMT